MKKWIIFLVIVCLLVGAMTMLADNRLAGSWRTTLEMELVIESDRQWLDGMELESIQVPCVLTFSGDHSYTFRLNREALPQTLTQIREQVGVTLMNSIQERGVAWIEEWLAAADIRLDLAGIVEEHDLSLEKLMDTVLKLTGMSFDELLSRSLRDETIMEILTAVETEGSYRALPGVIFLGGVEGSGMSPMQSLTYRIRDDILTIRSGLLTYEQLPMEFAR